MTTTNDNVHIVPRPIEKAEILYQAWINLNVDGYDEPIPLSMRLFRIHIPQQQLWLPFQESHPYQLLRLCWKFPDEDPEMDAFDLSGFKEMEAIKLADERFAAQGAALTGHSIADSIKGQLHDYRQRVRNELDER